MVARHPGYALFPVTPQAANFQMTGGDLHIKAVIDTLIVQILIGVQLIRYAVHLVRVGFISSRISSTSPAASRIRVGI